MTSISPLSLLTTSSQPNANVIFQGESFPIFKGFFATYSKTAAEQDHCGFSEFVVRSSATRE
jgi:hypothetical protein